MSYNDDDLLTVAEIITEARISRSTWHKMVKTGTAPPIVKLATAQRIRYGAFREWLKQQEAMSHEPRRLTMNEKSPRPFERGSNAGGGRIIR